MPINARTKIVLACGARDNATCLTCRRKHRTRELTFADANAARFCDVCVIDVTSPAERAAVDAVNAFDSAVWDVRLLAKRCRRKHINQSSPTRHRLHRRTTTRHLSRMTKIIFSESAIS
jgi:hypothetical protein